MRFVSVVLGLAACATGGRLDGDDAHAVGDGPHRDSPITVHDAPAPEVPLLLSEVELVTGGKEFIEIVNPTAQLVDLSTYYLSDSGDYWKLPNGSPTVAIGDFIARFPAGSMLASHGVITVAIGTAAAFATAYTSQPTYSIGDGTIDVITAMTPSLTDTGEIIALFSWDGHSALVTDVDLLLAGQPTVANGFVSKSGVMQGGATYRTDANTMQNQAAAPGTGKSTKRIALEVGHETQTGNGNGVHGDDETSEVTSATWDSAFTAPTPGIVPLALQ